MARSSSWTAPVRPRFDEILDFAGNDRFIDTPMQRFSRDLYSGPPCAVAASTPSGSSRLSVEPG
jgi:ABC-type polysaccharide/polyol phosphate transport system ATPase subunit